MLLEGDMLLAIDTSTQWVGLALFDGAQVAGEMIWRTHHHHTVELAPAVEGLLKRCGFAPTQLSALAVALGPGSFTSLRIGLALVKGMALALNLPVVGIPTLDIHAYAQPLMDIPMIAILQAGRGRLAAGVYANVMGAWLPQGEAKVTTLEDLSASIHKPTFICGELDAEERRVLARKRVNVHLAAPAAGMRRPSYLAELAWQRIQQGLADDIIALSPIYIHVAEPIPA